MQPYIVLLRSTVSHGHVGEKEKRAHSEDFRLHEAKNSS